MKKRKPSVNIEHRLTKLEQESQSLYTRLEDMSKNLDAKLEEIKKYVSNHLVHALEQTNADLKTLLDRKQEHEAVKTFLTHLLKFSGSIAALSWATIEVIKALKEWGIIG